MYDVVSLFAGIGGIDLGFIQAGFNVCWANEQDHAACNTFRHNFGSQYLVEGDIHDIDESVIPHCDVLAAGFPCQSFSIAGKKKGFSDPRGQLFFDTIRIARKIHPPVIFLENVENLMEHDNGNTFQVIHASLLELGHIVHYRPMPSHEYANIPQTRRRIFIVATWDAGFSRNFRFPEPMPLTVRATEWIDRRVKQPDIYYFTGKTPFERYAIDCVQRDDIIYRTYHGSITETRDYMCPTLTANMFKPHNAPLVRDCYGVRRLTLKECLHFQGFPPDYYFPKSITISDAYRQIGNSVTVPVVARIAKQISVALSRCNGETF